ncbi:flavin reductase family protein [Streptomyces sp. YS-B37]|uniref:flavin reductase family protein n=1 Tax=Streptomyces sp. YS-B37 TaxID=3407669 RepID=UPI003B50AFAE
MPAHGSRVVTATSPDGPVGCTANSLMSLSADPPTVLVSLASTSRTLAHAVSGGVFGVNILARDQRALCRHFAQGDPPHRFDDVPHELRGGVSVLPDAIAALACRLEQTTELVDHTLLTGSPLCAEYDPTATPLVVHRRREHGVDA